MASVRPRDNPAITILPTETIDGVAQDPEANAQVVVLATDTSGAGDLASVSPGTPLSIADASPTLEPLGTTGSALVPSDGGLVVDANTTRSKIDILNPASVRVWLGIGVPAQVNAGGFLDPGGAFTEYTQTSIYAVADDNSEITVTYVEWGT